jgi:hypothetical protein
MRYGAVTPVTVTATAAVCWRMVSRAPAWDERILAHMKPGVDPTLIAESLRLTPTERLIRLQKMLAFVELVQSRPDHAVPRTPRDAQQG